MSQITWISTGIRRIRRIKRGWRVGGAVMFCLVMGAWWFRDVPSETLASEDPYDMEVKNHAKTLSPTIAPTVVSEERIKHEKNAIKTTTTPNPTSEAPRLEPQSEKNKEDMTTEPTLRPSQATKSEKSLTVSPSSRPTLQEQPESKVANQTEHTIPASRDSPLFLNQSLADQFVEQWCQLEGAEWFPSSESTSWQQRAPLFLLPGTSDSGIATLSTLLRSHPDAVPTTPASNQLEFFLHFRGYLTIQQKTKVWSARQKLYARHYRGSDLRSSEAKFSFDATSHYMFAVPPQRIFCVLPWIKIAVVLRNPVDRVVVSYQTAVKLHHFRGSFTDWVEQDFAVMREAGLLGDDAPKRGSLEEEDAWFRYLQLTRLGPIGQSLYELQLRHWFQAIRDLGRRRNEVIKFVRYEQWKADPQRHYNTLLDFLGIPRQSNVEWGSLGRNNTVALLDAGDKDKETLSKLSTFFSPYNKRLYRLLGGDWKGCWDK